MPNEIPPRLSNSEKFQLALEHHRSATDELLRRVELQIKLAEMCGFLTVAVYSGVVISGQYLLLFAVPLLEALAALWWIDRQGIIILLRCFLLEELEAGAFPWFMPEDLNLAHGWQLYFQRHYYSTSKTVHIVVFTVGFVLALAPAVLFCFGCIVPAMFGHARELKVVAVMESCNRTLLGRVWATTVLLLCALILTYGFVVKRKHRRFSRTLPHAYE